MRLIDADALMETITSNHYPLATSRGSIGDGMFTFGIQQAVDEQPTIEVVTVVHGRWEDSEEHKGWQVCSACRGCYVDKEWVDGKKWLFCPNCGARMDGEEAQHEH